MGLFEGKKGLILGVANDRSIAWAIAKKIMSEGGECGFTHLPDREGDDKKKNRRRVEKCFDKLEGDYKPSFLTPLNVQSDEQITQAMDVVKNEFGKIDFLLHSIAYADRADLGDTIDASREGFQDGNGHQLLQFDCRLQRRSSDSCRECLNRLHDLFWR